MVQRAWILYLSLCLIYLTTIVSVASNEAITEIPPTEAKGQLTLEKRPRTTETIKAKRGAGAKKTRQEDILKNRAKQQAELEELNLPEDTSSRFTVRELRISGNNLISTEELLENMPLLYNTSDKPLTEAEPGDLYDFRILYDIVQHPGQPREVSRRTMQGFTQYILAVYQDNNYAGIYVYVSAKAIQGEAKLQDGVLPIEVVEATISEITVTPYNVEREEVEKGILKSSVIKAWSPAKAGDVVNKKKLDDFVNLLNLNADRYISAVISRGSEPNTLALGYELYEAKPWHYYVQLDNSGTEERQWAPRVGVINTNITGRDDKVTAVYQGPLESDFDDNYAFFGSYEFPLFTPRLRLNLYGGRSEFDTSGGGIDFLGKGSFYGCILRYNIFQKNGWFFDITSSLSREKSKVTPSLFPTMGSDVEIDLWAIGANAYRSDDRSSTSVGFNRIQSIGGSPQRKFWDPNSSTGARTNIERDFAIYIVSAAHSRYLDPNNIQRLSTSIRFINSDERLAPSKMTTFGGLYSVRGYKEDEIVADGGLLFSAQYEFDLVKHSHSKDNSEVESKQMDKNSWLRRFALLSFIDFARAKTKSRVAGEKGTQELCSLGLGTAVTLGENFDAGIYYGFPVRSTDDTRAGRGRWNFSFILRW